MQGEDQPVACVDCGDEASTGQRCRDCDIDYAVATSSCRECLRWILNPELVETPIAEQHRKGCGLRDEQDYGARTPEEVAAIREGRARLP